MTGSHDVADSHVAAVLWEDLIADRVSGSSRLCPKTAACTHPILPLVQHNYGHICINASGLSKRVKQQCQGTPVGRVAPLCVALWLKLVVLQ